MNNSDDDDFPNTELPGITETKTNFDFSISTDKSELEHVTHNEIFRNASNVGKNEAGSLFFDDSKSFTMEESKQGSKSDLPAICLF